MLGTWPDPVTRKTEQSFHYFLIIHSCALTVFLSEGNHDRVRVLLLGCANISQYSIFWLPDYKYILVIWVKTGSVDQSGHSCLSDHSDQVSSKQVTHSVYDASNSKLRVSGKWSILLNLSVIRSELNTIWTQSTVRTRYREQDALQVANPLHSHVLVRTQIPNESSSDMARFHYHSLLGDLHAIF